MAKKILLAIVGVVILLIVIGFFLPGNIEVTRSEIINAPAQSSFEEVNNLERWPNWSYWNTLDPEMKITYGTPTSGVGAWYSWEGPEIGNGKITITESTPYSSIKVDLDFMDNAIAKAWYTFEPEADKTQVTMGFYTEFGYNPFMRWIGVLFFKSEMNKAFEYNLTKLKAIAEAKPK